MKASPDKVTLRQCAACRQFYDRTGLFRIVHNRQTSDIVVLDPGDARRVIFGRSTYLCGTETCLKMALKGRKIQKALKTFVPDAILVYLQNSIKGRDNGE